MVSYFENQKTIYFCFMSQLQYTNKHQNFSSNSVFQFIKTTTTTATTTNKQTKKPPKTKRNETLGTRILFI